MNIYKYTFYLLLLFAIACTQPPDYPDEPVIIFERMTKNTMVQSALITGSTDSLLMTVSFTDGDGDLGEEGGTSSPISNVYLIDTRIGDTLTPRAIPMIPEQGAGNGISGNINFTVFSTCCIYLNRACEPFIDHPIDTLTYLIQIQDRAGNFSNVVESDPIFLLCQ